MCSSQWRRDSWRRVAPNTDPLFPCRDIRLNAEVLKTWMRHNTCGGLECHRAQWPGELKAFWLAHLPPQDTSSDVRDCQPFNLTYQSGVETEGNDWKIFTFIKSKHFSVTFRGFLLPSNFGGSTGGVLQSNRWSRGTLVDLRQEEVGRAAKSVAAWQRHKEQQALEPAGLHASLADMPSKAFLTQARALLGTLL